MNSSLLLAIAVAVLSVTQCHATERFGSFGGNDDWYDDDWYYYEDYDYEEIVQDCAGTACDPDTEFCIMNGLADDKTPRFACAKKMEGGMPCFDNDDWCLSDEGCNGWGGWGVCHAVETCTGWFCLGRSDETKNEERAGRMKKQVRSRKTKNEERAGRMKKQVRSRKTKNEE